MDAAMDRLRSKHIRTLEILQRLVDENRILKQLVPPGAAAAAGLDCSALPPDMLAMAARPAANDNEQQLRKEFATREADLQHSLGQAQESCGVLERRVLRLTQQLEEQRRAHDGALAELRLEASDQADRATRAEAATQDAAQQRDAALRELSDARAAIAAAAEAAVAAAAAASPPRVSVVCAATQTRSLTDLDAAGFGLEPAGRQGDSSARAELARLRAQVEELRAAAGRAEEQWGKERERFCAAASRAATEEAEAAAERDALKKEVQRLRHSMAELQTQLGERRSVFAEHVRLRRENQELRAQVEEMRNMQRKFLKQPKRQTLVVDFGHAPPALR